MNNAEQVIKLKDAHIAELDGLLQSRQSEIRDLQNKLNKAISSPVPASSVEEEAMEKVLTELSENKVSVDHAMFHVKEYASLQSSPVTGGENAEGEKEIVARLAQECFDKLKELNPKGGIKEFIRIAVEYGYNKAAPPTGAVGGMEVKGFIKYLKDEYDLVRSDKLDIMTTESYLTEYLSTLPKVSEGEGKEYILCAANYYNDGKKHIHTVKNIETGFVVCGRRHHNCINTFASIVGFPYSEEGLRIVNTEVQGFLTNTNRFVDRQEGYAIAYAANQIKGPNKGRSTNDIGLTSEDLY